MTDPKRTEVVNATIMSVKAQGCTCDVKVTIVDHDEDARASRVQVAHDEWCPLIRVMEERPPEARTQGVIYRPQP